MYIYIYSPVIEKNRYKRTTTQRNKIQDMYLWAVGKAHVLCFQVCLVSSKTPCLMRFGGGFHGWLARVAWQCQTHLSKFVRETGRSAFNSVWLVVAIQCLHLFPRGLSKGIGWRPVILLFVTRTDAPPSCWRTKSPHTGWLLLARWTSLCHPVHSFSYLSACLCSCMPVHACPSHLSASLCLSAHLPASECNSSVHHFVCVYVSVCVCALASLPGWQLVS